MFTSSSTITFRHGQLLTTALFKVDISLPSSGSAISSFMVQPLLSQYDPHKTMTGLLLLLFLFNFVAPQRQCGVSPTHGFGIQTMDDDPSDSKFGEFPWMAAVLAEVVKEDQRHVLEYQCGGSLIHPQVILTAAHCVKKDQRYHVRVGEWNTQTKDELFPHQNRQVIAVVVHPRYSTTKHFNDIAVLVLDRPVDIAENVNIVCLPKQQTVVEENTTCYASGWGKNHSGGRFHAILKKVDLPIVSKNVCQRRLRTTRLGSRFKLHKSFICAGGEPGKDTCKGDGGSPLVCRVPNNPSRYFQFGVVSWGIGCGQAEIPGVYINVAQAVDWINQQIDQVARLYYTR